MGKHKPPVTAAVRMLRRHGVEFSDHLYAYEEKGGALQGAQLLGVAEHRVIKTLIMEDDRSQSMIVLMHGDREVSTKALARLVGAKSVMPCDPNIANKHSGYLVGGTSPFGVRRKMPVYMEASILELERIYINGGKRGYLVGLAPADARRILDPTLVEVAIPA